MNIKKILIISLCVFAIILSLNVASAGFFDGLFGSDQPTNVTISGINFTIPAGYDEDTSMSKVNEMADDGQIMNSKSYTNGEFVIGISVSSYGGDGIYWNGDELFNTTQKTIAGKEGYISHDSELDSDFFMYVDGDKGVIVSAHNETIIEDIIS